MFVEIQDGHFVAAKHVTNLKMRCVEGHHFIEVTTTSGLAVNSQTYDKKNIHRAMSLLQDTIKGASNV